MAALAPAGGFRQDLTEYLDEHVFSKAGVTPSGEDLFAMKLLLSQLSPLSERVNMFVQSQEFFPDATDSSETMTKAITSLEQVAKDRKVDIEKAQTGDADGEAEKSKVSLEIIIGPREFAESEPIFRFNNDEKQSPRFRRILKDWNSLKTLAKVFSHSSKLSAPKTIPRIALSVLGFEMVDVQESLHPSTKDLHDVMVRFEWR